MKPDVTITADGAAWPNDGTGAGGWACVVRANRMAENAYYEQSGGLPVATNNVAELTALLMGLRFVRELCGVSPLEVLLRTDSQYAINCCTVWGDKWEGFGWKKKKKGGEIKNLALIQEIRSLAKPYIVTWEWVRGHSGDPDNERCDALAQTAMPEKNRKEMEEFERWRQAQKSHHGHFPLESSENLPLFSDVRAE